jgi:predicted acetyltransferase
MRVEILQSTPETAHVLRNLYPLYLHDLSEFNGSAPNPHGVYEPVSSVRTIAEQGDLAYQKVWWEKPGVLFPFLAWADGAPAGFALVSTSTYAPPGVDFCMQEFFVVRGYRRRGVGGQLALGVFEQFRGAWELAVLSRNEPAQTFWRGVIDRHTGGHFSETAGPGPEGEMHTFRFVNSPGSPQDDWRISQTA